ncbi:MAG TPA: AtpZ/AtpI family protein [Syntrophorhabdaceae bacterium]|jgi:ATP synthase protein I|nr:AtpZ/AtpI family protein [Syntrophorhabdaceae bacterium]HNS14577.1 AtpZ/AtpI family protein [Syntrophorhabdaceae bacterium]HNT67767.1 AtpZ/AtpI family protein [Syntrophorhabdaceae bacterium]
MLENDGNLMDMTIQDSKKDLVRSLMSYSSLGIEMGLSVAIGIAIGYFLDRFFKTSPYLTIIFMIFGVAAAMKTIFQLLKKVQKDNERDKHQ